MISFICLQNISFSCIISHIRGGVTYAESGVDVGAGDRFIDLIKPLSKATLRPGCDAELGIID